MLLSVLVCPILFIMDLKKSLVSVVQDIVVGESCLKFRNQLDISYPVNNGIIQNWDDMCHVWDHAFFNELKVAFLLFSSKSL